MKELSIKEKAKAYDEAIERAKEINNEHKAQPFDVMLKVFPELKESEDERIMKDIIVLVKDWWDRVNKDNISTKEQMIAWLEKQGTPAKLSEEEQNRFAKCVLTSCASSFIDYLDAHKYEGKMCVSNGECEDIENAFHNAMWDRLHRYYCKYIEKQGEQKSIDNLTPQDAMDIAVAKCFEQGEQKPVDKVEPKCKIEKGKWYVCIRDLLDNYANKAFRKGDTYLSTQDGSLIPSNSNVPFEVVCPDTYFRDWTIQNAKDGDIIYAKHKFNVGSYIRIFHKLEDEKCWGYCNVYSEGLKFWEFNDDRGFLRLGRYDFYPATKEQCDQLEKAMADAGYTFDFEKKELKKIEQKPADKCEGCNNVKGCITCVDGDQWAHIEEQTPAWSEEDESYLNTTIAYLKDAKEFKKTAENCIDWLNSLRPQNRWKPSDEQMNILDMVLTNESMDDNIARILRELREQLKRLREE